MPYYVSSRGAVELLLMFHELNAADHQLLDKAKQHYRKRKSRLSSVAAAARAKGRTFLGMSIDIGGPEIGTCAEMTAIGTMVSEGMRAVETVVAVSSTDRRNIVIPPCGRCRQFMSRFGNPYVLVPIKGKVKKVRLSDLNPLPFK